MKSLFWVYNSFYWLILSDISQAASIQALNIFQELDVNGIIVYSFHKQFETDKANIAHEMYRL